FTTCASPTATPRSRTCWPPTIARSTRCRRPWPRADWPTPSRASQFEPCSGRRADMSDAACFDLTDKVAVVTGALDVLAARLREAGARDAIGVAADITKVEDVEALRETVTSRFGALDVLV